MTFWLCTHGNKDGAFSSNTYYDMLKCASTILQKYDSNFKFQFRKFVGDMDAGYWAALRRYMVEQTGYGHEETGFGAAFYRVNPEDKYLEALDTMGVYRCAEVLDKWHIMKEVHDRAIKYCASTQSAKVFKSKWRLLLSETCQRKWQLVQQAVQSMTTDLDPHASIELNKLLTTYNKQRWKCFAAFMPSCSLQTVLSSTASEQFHGETYGKLDIESRSCWR